MVRDNIIIEGARIFARNFSGAAGEYNAPGQRNFCVFLDADIAAKLKTDGWNVKYLRPREEGDEPQAYMQVTVRFGDYPPKIYLVTSRGKTLLTEDKVGIIDWAEIESVDLIIRPRNWEVRGATGVKAYAKSVYVKIVEDKLDLKYADVPDSAKTALTSEDDETLPF